MKRSNGRKQRYFVRLSLAQRIQHIVLITSFTVLVVTGLPIRYPESSASSIVIKSIGGMAARGVLHRVAAVMLIGVCVYHVLWTLFTERGHKELMAFVPKLKDAKDLYQELRYMAGLSQTRPRFDRFNWVEKFEYLAMGWGSAVMIATGLMLWFEGQAMLVFPKWMLDIARVCHSFEALLAFLAIIIWHMYHVHIKAEYFPMNRAWLDGLISEDELKHHHPLEYERILRDEVPPVEVEPERVKTKTRTKVGAKSKTDDAERVNSVSGDREDQ